MKAEIQSITGLRAVAILSVLFYHIDQSLIERGFLGVDLFFVISGFVVANSVFRRSDMPTVLHFYYARLRRIFPALVTMVLLTLVASYFLLLPAPFVDTAQQAIATLLIRANYYFNDTTNYFADAAASRLLLHTWSLSVEEQFYLAFPLVLFLRSRLLIGVIATVACAWSLIHSYDLIASGNEQLAFYGIGSRCWQFGLGIIGAVILNSPYAVKRSAASAPIQAVTLLGIAACLFTPSSFGNDLKIQVSLSVAAFLFLLLSTHETVPNSIMSRQPLRFVGLISYSLYLYHWPVIVFMRMYVEQPIQFAIGATLISTLLATASYYSVETFFRRSYMWAISRWPRLIGAASVASAGALIVCAFVVKTGGVPSRLPPTVQKAMNAKTMAPEFKKCFEPPGTKYEVSVLEMATHDKLCRLGPAGPSEALDFALIGDSHGFAMTSAMQNAGLATGKRGILATYAGCPGLSGLTHGAARMLKCAEFFSHVAEQIKKYHIKKVFLISRWDLYLFGGLPGGLDAATPAVMQIADRYGDPIEPFRAFDFGLKQTVELFKDLDVYFVLTVPQQKIDVPPAAAANFMVGRSIDRFFVPASISRARREKMMAHLRPYISNHFQVYDPSKRLCNDQVCKSVIDGIVLYYDDDHLNDTGAGLFEKDFEQLLTE